MLLNLQPQSIPERSASQSNLCPSTKLLVSVIVCATWFVQQPADMTAFVALPSLPLSVSAPRAIRVVRSKALRIHESERKSELRIPAGKLTFRIKKPYANPFVPEVSKIVESDPRRGVRSVEVKTQGDGVGSPKVENRWLLRE
jgi:hypothetical protein